MKALVLLAVVFSLNTVSAETTPSTTATVTTTSSAKILAGAEIRPTYFPNAAQDASYGTENNVLAGYRFDSNTWLYYRQDFATNLYGNNVEGGLGLTVLDGSVRGGIGNIWQNGNWSLNYEGRAYTPTSEFSSESGMITYVRNYFYLNNAISEQVTLYVAEAPTFHFYSQDLNAVGNSNPNLENRTYVGVNWAPTSNLKVYFPIKMSNVHARVSGEGQSAWGHRVYINPEIFYSIDANLKVGLGLETRSFVDAAFGDFSFSRAFDASKSYAVIAASL